MSNLYPENLSQFKKWLKPGSKMEVILNIYKPEFIGLIKEVSKVQSNGIYFKNTDKSKGDLWLAYEKSSNYKFNGDIVSIIANLYSHSDREQLRKFANQSDITDIINKKITDRKNILIKDGAKFIDDDNYICIEYRFI